MNQISPSDTYSVAVLAGDRGPNDPLIQHTGAPCKALVEIAGVPLLLRVLHTLMASRQVNGLWLSGPTQSAFDSNADLEQLAANKTLQWQPPGPSPATSALEVMQASTAPFPFLLTTADHALLTPEIVDYFCQKSAETGADVTVGLAPYPRVQQAFPDMKKTVIRMRDGEFCGCNLFSFQSKKSLKIVEFWRTVEQERKNPLRLITLLGWTYVMRYKLGLLSLDQALGRLSGILGLSIRPVILDWGDAAVDVDSVSDYELVSKRFEC